MNHLRYKTKYATGYGDACRACRATIPVGKVILAVMIQVNNKNYNVHNVLYYSLRFQSRKDDRKEPVNYHVKCFFEKQRLKSEGDVDGFEKLRIADQNRIKGYISKLISKHSIPYTCSKCLFSNSST